MKIPTKLNYVLIISLSVVLLILLGIIFYLSVPNHFSSSKPKNNTTKTDLNKKPNESVLKPENKAPYKVKGIYITAWSAGSSKKLNHFINLLNNTELNTLVIDVKDDMGRVAYTSNVPLAKEIGASNVIMITDIDSVMKKLKEYKIHTVARIVVFKDPILSTKKPELAIKKLNGNIWRDRNNLSWVNPYKTDAWKYNIDLAKEAVSKGFDEVQFDYVRFPADGKLNEISYAHSKTEDLTKPINEFLAQAKKELGLLGIPVSADIFGIVTTNIGDIEKIGQDLEKVSKNADYISPMVYPSHYAFGQYSIPKPDFEPYNVVFKSLSTAKTRLDKITGQKAIIRPYLQDFSASWLGRGNFKKYTAEDVKAQIKAVYNSGLDEWILWNANNHYSEAALEKEK